MPLIIPKPLKKVVTTSSLYKTTIIADGPIAYYRLGESTGIVAVDEMSLQDGVYTNSPTLGVSGLLVNDSNKAVSLSNVSDEHINLLDKPQFSFTNGTNDLPFSFEAIINLNDLTNAISIISKSGTNSTLENEYTFSIGAFGRISGHLYDGLATNQHRWITADGLIIPGNTYHIIITYAGSVNTGLVYLNGNAIMVTYENENSYNYMKNYGKDVNLGTGFLTDPSNPIGEFNGVLDEVSIYNYVLTPSQALKHYNASQGISPIVSYPDTVVIDGPIAYWRMNSDTGRLSELDVSGSTNLHNLTFITPANIKTKPSIINSDTAMVVNQPSNYSGATSPNHLDFSIPLAGFTVEAWLTIDSLDTDRNTFPTIVQKGNINTSLVFFLDNPSSGTTTRLAIRTRISPDNMVTGEIDLIAGNSYYLVGMIDTDQHFKLYVNGILDKEYFTAQNPVNNSNPLYVGTSESAGIGNKLHSVIDEVAIYQKAFTDAEILARYNAGLLSIETPSYFNAVIADNPTVYYRLGESIGDIVMYDSMGLTDGTHSMLLSLESSGLLSGDTNTCANYNLNNQRSYNNSNEELVDFPGDMSLELLINLNSLNGSYTRNILIKGRNNQLSGLNYWLTYNNVTGKINWIMKDSNMIESDTVLSVSTIYHIVALRNGSNIYLYIDGRLEASGSFPAISLNIYGISIGAPGNTANQPSNMLIDEVALYNYSLPVPRIIKHYKNSREITTISYSDMVITSKPDAYYQQDEPDNGPANSIAVDTMGHINGININVTLKQQPLKVNDLKSSIFYDVQIGGARTTISPISSSPLHSAGNICVELLFYKNFIGGPQWKGLVAKVNIGVTEYSINLYNENVILIENDNGASFFSPTFTTLQVRHLVVNMASNGNVDVYLNGSLLVSGIMVRLGSISDITIGNHILYGYESDCMISDTAFYSRLLSIQEISDHANKALTG